jgi:hypothetical protein
VEKLRRVALFHFVCKETKELLIGREGEGGVFCQEKKGRRGRGGAGLGAPRREAGFEGWEKRRRRLTVSFR